VASEFSRLAGANARFAGLNLPGWIEIFPAPPLPAIIAAANLDLGEAAAIALCLSQTADALLVDESLGRAVAVRLGLRTIGILGILIEARARTLIPKIAPVLDRLEQEAGFWVAPVLRIRVLHLAKE
jgi:predicted nucleic acid-binding protein